jgi:hypothetical protein
LQLPALRASLLTAPPAPSPNPVSRAGAHSMVTGWPETPAAPGEVHPTASSLSSNRALPLPLNSAHQLLSTV